MKTYNFPVYVQVRAEDGDAAFRLAGDIEGVVRALPGVEWVSAEDIEEEESE